jgi:hypothetical protein
MIPRPKNNTVNLKYLIFRAFQVSPFESFISPVEDVVTSHNPHLRVQVMHRLVFT